MSRAIASVSAIAPLHIEAELEGIRIVENLLGAVPQVGVFGTGFHRQMPLPAAVYPGPYEWFESGIRRYGFHGISHQCCSEHAAQILGADKEALRVVTCHLGNGCSVAAVHGVAACDGLDFLGVRLDACKNARPNLDADVSSASSRIRVLVIRSEADWAIAKECWKLLHAGRRVEAEWRRSKEQTV